MVSGGPLEMPQRNTLSDTFLTSHHESSMWVLYIASSYCITSRPLITQTHCTPAPKLSTLLDPIPSELVALAPPALPHIVVVGHTSRWAFALLPFPFSWPFPLPVPFCWPLLLAFAPLIFAVWTTSGRLPQIGLELFMVWTGIPMPKHEVGEPPGPLQQSRSHAAPALKQRWSTGASLVVSASGTKS